MLEINALSVDIRTLLPQLLRLQQLIHSRGRLQDSPLDRLDILYAFSIFRGLGKPCGEKLQSGFRLHNHRRSVHRYNHTVTSVGSVDEREDVYFLTFEELHEAVRTHEADRSIIDQRKAEHVSFEKPHEVREGTNWRLELLNLAGGAQVGRITVQPGWRWSQDVKPVAGTDLCMAPHQQYQLSGHMHIVMSDGTELDTGPGEIISLPPGHDAWVVGEEQVVAIDWQGASVWAAQQA